jgi:hypothetical protein
LRDGPRSSEICNRDAGREDPNSGSREADMKECNPRAGSPEDSSNSSRGARNAVAGHTRKEDSREGRGAFRNAVAGHTRRENLEEDVVARNAGAVRMAATVSEKAAEALNQGHIH